MSLPYRIERFPGPGANVTAMKIYPDGVALPASPEETQIWDHLREVETELENMRANQDARHERMAEERAAASGMAAPGLSARRR